MTTLAITPNWKNKSAKFKGTVAAGEHVSVTIQNDDGEGGEFIADASTLRLRVVNPCNGRTLAIFPEPVPEGETPETWDSDLSPLRCTLNLNTVQMLKAVPPAANVSLLFVLDDYDNNTLYFKEQFPVEHWPRLRGEEEPTDLDNYKDIIADFNTRLNGYDTRITGAENAAQAATANASAAAAKANQAVGIANQAVSKAETAQNSAAASAAAAHNSALAAEEAQEAAESAAESINSPDATLTEEGVAADAKATGEAIAAEETRAKAAEAAEKARAEGVESGLDTRLTAAEKAIDDEAVLRAAADADLEANKADKSAVAAISSDVAAAQTAISNLSANKADKATTYTKTEVDTKIAGVQTFQKYLVNELPDPDEADMKGLYLVPTGETTEEGDLCEEWTVIEEDGEKRWEKIGAKAVDLTLDDTVTRASANGVKSSGIWSAIWGTASTAFSSLYDWCVAQLAGKASKADATLAPIYSDTPTFSEWTYSGVPDGWIVVTPPRLVTEPEILQYYNWSMGVFDGNLAQSLYSTSAIDSNEVVFENNGDSVITATRVRTDIIGYQLGSQTDKPLASEAEVEALRQGKADRAANPTAGNLAALDAQGNPTDSGVKASDKLDASSAAPAFSSDSSVSYPVGSHVTYNGKLYKCTTATTGGTWVAGSWAEDTMTDPDAALDITAQNQLRVVAKDGTLLWAQGYDLASTSSATLACDAVNNFTFADGATSQAFALPTAPTGKVGDFGLDIDNSANTGAATMTLTGLDTTFSVVVPEGESLTDMLAIAAGELARFYITLSTFRVNNLPTWHIVKQVVENGGATA